MANKCEVCGKTAVTGSSISRRGLAKKKGGIGKKITGVARRRFLPNMQTVSAVVKGQKKRLKVCTSCIKAGKVTKA